MKSDIKIQVFESSGLGSIFGFLSGNSKYRVTLGFFRLWYKDDGFLMYLGFQVGFGYLFLGFRLDLVISVRVYSSPYRFWVFRFGLYSINWLSGYPVTWLLGFWYYTWLHHYLWKFVVAGIFKAGQLSKSSAFPWPEQARWYGPWQDRIRRLHRRPQTSGHASWSLKFTFFLQ